MSLTVLTTLLRAQAHSPGAGEQKKLYRFFKGGDDRLPGMKVENMFIQMLEGLHQEEAEVLVKAVNKTLHKKYRVTLAVVKEAFPNIEWGGQKVEIE